MNGRISLPIVAANDGILAMAISLCARTKTYYGLRLCVQCRAYILYGDATEMDRLIIIDR